jgi:glycosyltransferase involved in cell wall biosynthesis
MVGHAYLLAIHQQKLDELSRRGARVGALVPSNWRYLDGLFCGCAVPPERGYESFHLLTAPVLRPGHVASYFFEPLSLCHALAAFPSDIVHVDQEVYSLTTAQVAIAAKAAGRKVAVFGWENLDRKLPAVQRAARAIVLRTADAILAGSAGGAELLRWWGYKGRVEVIPQFGVDTGLFRPAEKECQAEFTIGYAGRLVREKGLDVLWRAMAALAAEGFRFRALICGSGPYREELVALGLELGLADRIHWIAEQPHREVPNSLREMDVLVLPSRTAPSWKEQFGHVLIEAMAAEVPVVGAASGAIPEVIGRPELVFPEEDHRALAEILRRFMIDPQFHREAREYCATRVRESYTHERIAERLTNLWREMLRPERWPGLV